MNKNTKQKIKLIRAEKLHFHGQPCHTDFTLKEKNPANKRTKPWKPARRTSFED
jgi:transposase-like protein